MFNLYEIYYIHLVQFQKEKSVMIQNSIIISSWFDRVGINSIQPTNKVVFYFMDLCNVVGFWALGIAHSLAFLTIDPFEHCSAIVRASSMLSTVGTYIINKYSIEININLLALSWRIAIHWIAYIYWCININNIIINTYSILWIVVIIFSQSMIIALDAANIISIICIRA